jgi:alanine racemase
VRSTGHIRPTVAEIDCAAVRRNAALLHRRTGVPLFAVVKADAYGHGAAQVAAALAGQPGVAGFAVSLVEEGIALRQAGITLPVLVMGPALGGGHAELLAHDLTPLVSDPGDLGLLARLGRERGRPVPVHVKVDTGMGRLGLALGDAVRLIGKGVRAGGLELAGVASHFACADSDEVTDPGSLTALQLQRFDRLCGELRAAGIEPGLCHTANSAATIRLPASHRDLVRPGLALYGNGDYPGVAIDLQAALTLRTAVSQLRWIEPGATVSYGALWRAERRSRLAVLPIGYADGLPRRSTGRAQVLIAGRRCPVVGAISMDIAIADVTSLGDEVAVGSDVVLLGQQGPETIRAAEWAAWAGITEYEVTCGISRRVPRVHR